MSRQQADVYDHCKKAGNQGDVVKHVALIAALDKVLDAHRGPIFKYADSFAGYAHTPLVKGNEWGQGVEKIFDRPELNHNRHTALYRKWYLSRPQLLGGVYPGSSLIAADVCAWKRKKVRLYLWDTSSRAFADLTTVFRGQGHTILRRSATPDEGQVRDANFVLIDPPNSKHYWDSIREFLKKRAQAILLWLPVYANTTSKPPGENRQSEVIRNDALALGYSATKARWNEGGRTIGCELIYRLPSDAKTAVREAVEHVVKIAGWRWRPLHYDPNLLEPATASKQFAEFFNH